MRVLIGFILLTVTGVLLADPIHMVLSDNEIDRFNEIVEVYEKAGYKEVGPVIVTNQANHSGNDSLHFTREMVKK